MSRSLEPTPASRRQLVTPAAGRQASGPKPGPENRPAGCPALAGAPARRGPGSFHRAGGEALWQHRFNHRTVKPDTLDGKKGAITFSAMKELLRTNDIVKLSWLEALMADAGIETLVLDLHTSIVEGSIGILPRRLMVSDADYVRARQVLRDAGEEAYTL